MADAITIDNFRNWKRTATVRQIHRRYDKIAEEAKKNGRGIVAEMQAQGYKDFAAFNKSCPQFPLRCWPIELAELGSGYVLYFHFLLLMSLLFLMLFVLQTPCLYIYAGVNGLVGWQWNDWHAAFSTSDPCRCIGDNKGITGLDDMPQQANYGTYCHAWDDPWTLGLCSDSSNCPVRHPGQWMCRPWCFAGASCPVPVLEETPSASNVHFHGMVRSYSACAKDEDEERAPSATNCSGFLGQDIAFNEPGVDRVNVNYAIGSHYLTPGNYGPDQATSMLIPTLYLVGVCIICTLVLLGYQEMIMTDHKVDADTTSPNDFALMVRGLPRTATDEQAIMKWFRENSVLDKEVEIVKVVIGWDVEEFRENIRQLKDLRAQLTQLDKDDPEATTIKRRMMEIQQALNSAAPNQAARIQSSGIVVVIFRYERDMRQCLRRWNRFWGKWFYCDSADACFLTQGNGFWKGTQLPLYPIGDTPACRIQVERAANPGDIHWEELGVQRSARYKMMAKTNGVMLLLVGVTFVITYLLTRLQQHVQEEAAKKVRTDETYGFLALSTLPAIVVAGMNALLQMAARRLGQHEYHETKTEEDFSQAMKMSIGMIMNTAGVLFFLNAQPKEWYKNGGLVNNAGTMLLINAVAPPLMPLLEIRYLLRWPSRRKLTQQKLDRINEVLQRGRSPDKPEQNKEFNQVLAEIEFWKKTAFAPEEMDSPRRFADALKTVFCCIFLCPVMPWVCIIGFLGMVLQYWMDKYMLLRKYKRPEKPANCSMALFSLKFVKFVAPLLLALASFLFLTPSWGDKAETISTLVLSSLVGGIFSIVMPMSIWGRCLLKCWTAPDTGKDMDYYQAQYMWSKEMKYHKDHFIYAKLPDHVNPEYLKPGTSAAVKADDVKSTYGTATAQAAESAVTGDTRPAADATFRGRRVWGAPLPVGEAPEPAWSPTRPAPTAYGVATPVEPPPGVAPPGVGSTTSAGVAHVSVAPTVASMSTGPTARGAIWEFQVNDHYKPFAADCQDYIESRYKDFSEHGGQARINVNTSGIKLSIDFNKMTQMKLDTRRRTAIRRRATE